MVRYVANPAESPFGGFGIPWNDWAESLKALLAQSIDSFAEATYNFINGAFSAGTFSPEAGGSQDWWIAVVGGTVNITVGGEVESTIEYPGMLNVMVMVMIPVLLIYVSFQVLLSFIRASTAGMLRAFGTSVLAVPMTYILGGLVFLGLRAADSTTHWILNVAGGTDDDVTMAGIFRLIGMYYDSDANDGEGGVLLDAGYEVWQHASLHEEPGRIILPWLILGILTIIAVLLMLMMIFRTTVILMLTMFTPVAVFSLSLEAAKAIFSKWLSFIVALLLAKPLAAAVVMFGMTMASLADDWTQLVAGATLIIIAAGMPLAMIALISFMTPDSARGADQMATTLPGSARRAAGTAAGVAAAPVKVGTGLGRGIVKGAKGGATAVATPAKGAIKGGAAASRGVSRTFGRGQKSRAPVGGSTNSSGSSGASTSRGGNSSGSSGGKSSGSSGAQKAAHAKNIGVGGQQ